MISGIGCCHAPGARTSNVQDQIPFTLCLINLWLIVVANLRPNYELLAVCNFERGGAKKLILLSNWTSSEKNQLDLYQVKKPVQLQEHHLSSNTLSLTILGKWRARTHKCNNFIHEPAVCNAHLASAAAEQQYNFHTYFGALARTLCLRSKAPNKGTFFDCR